MTRTDLGVLALALETGAAADLAAVMHTAPAVAHPDEPLRVIVYRMAETGLTRFPVVEHGTGRRLLGMIALDDLLEARAVHLEAERAANASAPCASPSPSGWRHGTAERRLRAESRGLSG